MAIEFYAPKWTFAPPSPPEPPEPPSANSLSIPGEAYGASTAYAIDPTLPLGPNDWDEADRANAARVDELNNEFIDLRDGILHDGDDAFFSRTGRDAILAAPEVHAKLEAARQETLGRAANDVQRQWLDETLGKHKIVEHFDIADHAGRQSVEWQKAVNRGRLDRLNRQAGRDHADPKMVEALANASEGSARDHARASGHRPDSPEAQAEVDRARSSVFRHAIEASLAKNQPRAALALYEKAKVPHDEQLAALMKDVAVDVEAAEWIARQDEATEATAQAALSASDLSPQARRRAFQKLQQQIAVNEDARAAKLKDLAAALATATKELSTTPSSYRRGTLATLVEGYASVDDDRARTLRALAEQESFLVGYAQSPVAAQQRILDTLPAGAERDFIEQIGAHQAEAFAKDPWAAGTAIYPDVGPAKPIDDPAGRMAQAHLIGQHRDGITVMPFSGDEIATLRKTLPTSPPERQAEVLKEMAMLPPETLPPLASALAGKNGSDDFQSHSIVGALSFHVDDAPEIAAQVLRGARLIQEKGDVGKPATVTTPEWRDALSARIGGDAPVPPIVRDTIATLYTYHAERAGQGREIDTELLDKAIFTTMGNVTRKPEIMLANDPVVTYRQNHGVQDPMLGDLYPPPFTQPVEEIEDKLSPESIAGAAVSGGEEVARGASDTEGQEIPFFGSPGGPEPEAGKHNQEAPTSGRGVSPQVEPPYNDPDLEAEFERWKGLVARLPDGTAVLDKYERDGGFMMSPFEDLSDVARAARDVRRKLLARLAHLGIIPWDPSADPVIIYKYIYNAFKEYIGQGGVFDYQRHKYAPGKDGYTQLRQFRNVSNFNVGLFCQQVGLPLSLTLFIAGRYARENSSNYRPGQLHGLDPQTRHFIELGHRAGRTGIYDAQ